MFYEKVWIRDEYRTEKTELDADGIKQMTPLVEVNDKYVLSFDELKDIIASYSQFGRDQFEGDITKFIVWYYSPF
jgi:hypothetical protein